MTRDNEWRFLSTYDKYLFQKQDSKKISQDKTMSYLSLTNYDRPTFGQLMPVHITTLSASISAIVNLIINYYLQLCNSSLS